MKKLMIVGIASVLSVSLAQASALTELRTEVKNSTKGDIWVTWKSTSLLGKGISNVRRGFGTAHHRYLLIPAGKKFTMAHTGDTVHVYAYPAAGKYAKYKIPTKGYENVTVSGSKDSVTIKEGKTSSSQGAGLTELRTHVFNKTDGDTWVTWKSATTQGKIFTTPFHWMREHRFVLIQPNQSYTMMHTGDKLSAYVYSAQETANAQEVEYQMQNKYYKRIEVSTTSGKLAVTESK